MLNTLRNLTRDDNGAAVIDYIVILFLVAMVVMIGLQALGASWVEVMDGVTGTVDGAVSGTPGN